MLDALWDQDPGAWTRIVVGLPADADELLGPAQPDYARDQLDHVIRAAEVVADRYDLPHVTPGCVAVALAATSGSRVPESDKAVWTATVADAYGFGDLGSFDALAEAIGIRLEDLIDDYESTEEAGGAGLYPLGRRIDRTFAFVSVATRLYASTVLFSASVGEGPWWLALVAFATLFSTQVQDLNEVKFTGATRPFVAPSRFPWLLLVAGACVGGSEARFGVLVAVVWLVVRVCAHGGELTCAMFSAMDGPELSKPPMVIRKAIRPFAAYPVLVRTRETVLSVAAGAAAAAAASFGSSWVLSTALVAAVVGVCVTQQWGLRSGWTTGWLTAPALVGMAWSSGEWSAAGLGLLTGLAGAAFMRRQRVPKPMTPLTGLIRDRRHRAALRAIGTGHPTGALPPAAPRPTDDSSLAVAALAHLELGELGRARELAAGITSPSLRSFTSYVDLRVANDLGAELPPVGTAIAPRNGPLAWAYHLEVLRAAGRQDPHDAAMQMAQALPRWIGRANFYATCEHAMLLAGMVAPSNRTAGQLMGVLPFILAEFVARRDLADRDALNDRSVHAERRAWQIGTRAQARVLIAGGFDEDLVDRPNLTILGSRGETLPGLLHFGSAADIVDYSAWAAEVSEQVTGQVSDATVQHQLQALATLNVTRHRLESVEDRRVWWQKFEDAMARALEGAVRRQDWHLLAELLEAARLQLSAPAEDAATTAADLRCVRVRGRSALAGAFYPLGDRPPEVDLEDAIARAVGAGGLWWSTWVSAGQLYWALVSAEGSAPVTGGRLDWTAEEELSELAAALPIPRPGESSLDVLLRAVDGPLGTAPSEAEARLATRLGALLPLGLRQALDRDAGRARLGIAPAPELARVPWPWVSVGRRRLVEAADTVIVPPVSLIPAAPAPEVPATLVGAVLDPSGDLPGAASLAQWLPDTVRILGAPMERPLAELSALLADLPHDGTLVLACHTQTGVDGSVGLLLGAGDAAATVGFAELSSGDLRLPRQVVAMACESSALHEARQGEWTVLGVGLLRAGADTAVVTAYPILERPDLDQALLGDIREGISLTAALGSLQLDLLVRWRSGDALSAPIYWAGLQLFGAIGVAPHRRVAPNTWVHEALVEGIDHAARWHSPNGLVTVDSVVRYLRTYGYEERLRPSARLRMWAWRRRDNFWPRESTSDSVRMDESLVEALRASRQIASELGTPVYDIEALFVAALRSDTPVARRFCRIAGWDPFSPSLAELLIDPRDDVWHHTGAVEARTLHNDDHARIYELLEVERPTGKDRWHHRERL
ncbi:CHAT domain-containing protein [Nocardioides sp. WS12]|uniref:CHAT domain-containing protein n=1 Tax=Nocardioides sp. WS12 TaxID=2486272 RepID=UPI0015F936CA|nr:CHAT domain-containing protein [Nocardioides sp. WS12]